MIILYIVSFLICIGYALFVHTFFNVSSISESYYMFENRKKGLGKLFYGWSVLTSMTLLPLWLELTPESFQFIPFLSSASLMAVGCFPNYKNEHNIAHPLSALFAGFLAILWGVFIHLWIIPISIISITIIILLIITLFKKGIFKDKLTNIGFTFWIELAAFSSIYSCILHEILN